jgi:hypothetical protein
MEPEQQKLPLPELNPEEYKFVDAYLECRDVGKAAIAAGLPARMGPPLYRRENVHAIIAERMNNIEQEHDKLVATRRLVHIEMLDKNLAQVITLPRKALLENPSLATPKVNAIELGYRRVGMLIDDNFIPDGSSGPARVEAERIFRPAEKTTIITHQIRETREVRVTERADEPLPPKTIEACDPAWDNF